jgi:glucose/arabinose dehydrogenase
MRANALRAPYDLEQSTPIEECMRSIVTLYGAGLLPGYSALRAQDAVKAAKRMRRAVGLLLLAAMSAVVARSGEAAQANVAVAPVKLDGEYTFDTAEQHRLRVTVVAKGFAQAFAVAVMPSGDALVSERSGQLRLVRNATGANGKSATLEPAPVSGLPVVEPHYYGSGLHDVVLHPHFAQNGLIYLTFNKAGKAPASSEEHWESHLALLRARLAGRALVDVEELYVSDESAYSGASRLAFGKDGMVYLTTSSPFGDKAQHLDSVAGKVLRLTQDGKAPEDNPFYGRKDAKPEVFSLGHRDQFGIAVHPATGTLLNAEHGPNGGDEVNLVLAARNYGWPNVTFGRSYEGPRLTESPVAAGIEEPLIVWLPSIAPTSLLVYDGNRFPQWRGNLFVGSARRGQVGRTGGLERVVVNDKLEELRRETLLTELHQRIHAVRQGPDGLLYVLTDDRDTGPRASALLRLSPVR